MAALNFKLASVRRPPTIINCGASALSKEHQTVNFSQVGRKENWRYPFVVCSTTYSYSGIIIIIEKKQEMTTERKVLSKAAEKNS